MSDKRGWWGTASKEQRLAQIDAGIELGMSAKQVAMNCGCVYEGYNEEGALISVYANRHGRYFRSDQSLKMRKIWKVRGPRERSKRAALDAYFSGEPVDFWEGPEQ